MIDRLKILLTRARDSAVNVHVCDDLTDALATLGSLQARQAHAVRRAIESCESRSLDNADDRKAVIAAVLDALGVQS